MMIDGCLAWERKDTTLEFSTIGARETHVGRRAVHTKVMSGLGLRWAEFILSCCSAAAWCWKSFALISPCPWVALVVGVVLFCFALWHSSLNVSLCCWSRVRSWHEFNVTNAVGAGRDRLDTHGLTRGAAFLAQYQSQALQTPLQHQKEKEHI